MIVGDKLMVFHAGAVDSSSVTSADDGTNIDLCALPSSAITSVFAEEDFVYIYFEKAGRFENGLVSTTEQDSDDTTAMVNIFESMEQAFVRITCTSGKEAAVIEDLWATMNSASAGPVVKFDFVTSGYTQPIENVSAAQVRRHVTTVTATSD